MAKMLTTQDPYVYQREHNAFLRELKQFHESRSTPFRRIPAVNGKEVDLFRLYNEVTNLGGWRKVNDNQRWESILHKLNLPKACANAGLALKHLYIRYLDHYEKIHFLGEDPDDDSADTLEHPSRKNQNPTFLVPLSYNQQQHEVADSVRAHLGMCVDFVTITDYEKVLLSLQSGLPNEVDFALNVCTLLSNEGRHTLRLDKAPRLIDCLIFHAGVWTENKSSLKGVLEKTWYTLEGRHMPRFWEDTVEDKEVRDLYFIGQKDKEALEDTDKELFNLSRQLGVREVEGQRIMQIATILWNLSFEEYNVPVLASSPACLQFLLLCVHCKWVSLRQIGLDILGNIASEISLMPLDYLSIRLIFRTLSRSFTSSDRYLMIRGLEILTSLCKLEGNEDLIIRSLDRRVYEDICSLLTIHDIMLLIYTLECLYYLTDLGHDACANVARIHKVIDVLISLITVEAQSYGPTACIAMKVVEMATPNSAPIAVPVTPRPQPAPPPTNLHHRSPTPITTPTVNGYQEADNDTFAYNWLKAYYEWCPTNSVKQNELYVDYQTTCNKLGKKGLVPPSQLLNLLKSLYAQIKTRPADTQSSRSTEVLLEGIKRRAVPLPVSIYMPTRQGTSTSPVQALALRSCMISPSLLPAIPATSGIVPNAGNVSFACLPSPLKPPSLAVAKEKGLPEAEVAACFGVANAEEGTSPSAPRPGTPSCSPILKAQLSAPPRPQTGSASSHHPHLQQALLGRTQPSATKPTPATPPSSSPRPANVKDSSTLIKSLLANKVSQNMLLRQQQQQQQLQLAATQTSPSISITPDSSQSTPTTTPIQVTDVPEGQRIIRIIKVTAPAQAIRKDGTIPILPRPRSPKSRLNGAQRSIQLEDARVFQVCAHVEQAKDIVDTSEFHEARIERIENHLLRTGGSDSSDKKRTDGPIESNEPTLDKLLRSSSAMTSKFQNGVAAAASQNGSRSETESPNLVTVETSPPVSGGEHPTRRKGVLADLLEGKVHKDALLTMNGIIDRSDKLPEVPVTTTVSAAVSSVAVVVSSTPSSVTSSTNSIVSTTCSVTTMTTPSRTASNAISANLVKNLGSNCTVIRTLMPMTNGEGLLVKTGAKVLLPPLAVVSDKCVANDNSDTSALSLTATSTATVSTVTTAVATSLTATTVTATTVTATMAATTTAVVTSVATTTVSDWCNSPSACRVIVPARGQESEELIGFPRVSMEQLNQLRQQAETLRNPSKRPCSTGNETIAAANSTTEPEPKRPRPSEELTAASSSTTDSPTLCGPDAKRPRPEGKSSPILSPSEVQQQVSAALLGSFSEKTNTSSPSVVTEATTSQANTESKTLPEPSRIVPPNQSRTIHKAGTPNSKIVLGPTVITTTSSFKKATEISSNVIRRESAIVAKNSGGTPSNGAVSKTKSAGSKTEYLCEWKDCLRKFESPMAVFVHACKAHAPEGSLNIPCVWEGCDQMVRQRLSLMTHLQDRHCNDLVMRMQSARRQQTAQKGTPVAPVPAPSSPHPGYAPNAAVQAIRRHALEFMAQKEIPDEREGPVTKSIRLTAALILRNLVVYSSLGKSLVRKYEAHLSMIAMSNVEASRTVAQCLWELNRQTEPHVR